MTDTISAVAGATVTAPTTSTDTDPSIADRYGRPTSGPEAGRLDKDAFLKLLVAQLKYQDPLQPTTNEEFIGTTALFTTVEKLDELTKQGASSALVSALSTASSLIGRTVTANQDGVTTTATVRRSQIVSGEVLLITDQGRIGLDQVTGIGPAGGSQDSNRDDAQEAQS